MNEDTPAKTIFDVFSKYIHSCNLCGNQGTEYTHYSKALPTLCSPFPFLQTMVDLTVAVD